MTRPTDPDGGISDDSDGGISSGSGISGGSDVSGTKLTLAG